jgi:uncharacterized membrane protein
MLLRASSLFADAARPELWTTPLTPLVDGLSLVVGVVGAAVIVWGAYGSAVRLIASETALARGQTPKEDTHRPPFAVYLLLGLDFLIAANVIKTLVAPDWQHAAILGGIALSRALISLGRKWEWPIAVEVKEPPAKEPHSAAAESVNGNGEPARTMP